MQILEEMVKAMARGQQARAMEEEKRAQRQRYAYRPGISPIKSLSSPLGAAGREGGHPLQRISEATFEGGSPRDSIASTGSGPGSGGWRTPISSRHDFKTDPRSDGTEIGGDNASRGSKNWRILNCDDCCEEPRGRSDTTATNMTDTDVISIHFKNA